MTEPQTLSQHWLSNVRRWPGRDQVAARQKDLGIWQSYSWTQEYEQVRDFSLGLVELGLQRGDRVAIIGDNDLEYLWGILAVLAAGGVGLFVGALCFRYGLKGSYFALVTLAFAEVFRIVALSVPFTGAGVGLMVPLREGLGNMQFGSRRGYIWLVLAFVTLALLVTWWLRHSRFGAWLQAVR